MRWKLFALVAVLILMVTTSAPSSKAEARGLVKEARILMVVGIGTDQKLELYSYQKGGIYTITVTLADDDIATGTCTETVQASLKEDPGLKIITIQMGEGNESLLITGEDKVPLDPNCFNNETKRVVVKVSVPNSASMASQIPVVPNSAPLGFSNVGIVGSSVVNSDGSTAASDGSWLAMERSFSVGQ
jgi:hypothetical protein